MEASKLLFSKRFNASADGAVLSAGATEVATGRRKSQHNGLEGPSKKRAKKNEAASSSSSGVYGVASLKASFDDSTEVLEDLRSKKWNPCTTAQSCMWTNTSALLGKIVIVQWPTEDHGDFYWIRGQVMKFYAGGFIDPKGKNSGVNYDIKMADDDQIWGIALFHEGFVEDIANVDKYTDSPRAFIIIEQSTNVEASPAAEAQPTVVQVSIHEEKDDEDGAIGSEAVPEGSTWTNPHNPSEVWKFEKEVQNQRLNYLPFATWKYRHGGITMDPGDETLHPDRKLIDF
jgi:hypothetical protein